MKRWEAVLIVVCVLCCPPLCVVLFHDASFVRDIEFIKALSSFTSLLSAILILVGSNIATVDTSSSAILRVRTSRLKVCTFVLLILAVAAFAISALALPFASLRVWAVSTCATLLILAPFLLARALFAGDANGK